MACKRSSVRPRYSPLFEVIAKIFTFTLKEFFDILTHKTVSKDLNKKESQLSRLISNLKYS